MKPVTIIDLDAPGIDQDEQRVMLQKMRSVSAAFYSGAIRTGVHAFVEFCGLMNEFIKICEHSGRKGVDFSQSNVHTGQRLHMEDYEVTYLAEKLECIYGATIQDSPELTRVFLNTFLPEVGQKLYAQPKERDELASYVNAHE